MARTASPRPTGTLSAADARRLALRAQGLHGEEGRPRTPAAVMTRVGALQLDTISVLARSHELVCLARCGPLPAGAVAAACWGVDRHGAPRAFEYWSHAASILPIHHWPWYAFRRRRMQSRPWHQEVPAEVRAEVCRRLEREGPLTATDLGGAKQGGIWWDWSPVKEALEQLLAHGEVVCTTRKGWKRVYDLAERAVPPELFALDLDDEACIRRLVTDAGRHLGVATVADLADYFRLPVATTAGAVTDSGLVPVSVEGWDREAWADPSGLEDLSRRGRYRTTLLSPFDSLIWDRSRTERLFGFFHRLEAYVPKPKRVHGYYAMPVLAGGRIVGRVDPGREGGTLVAKQVSVIRPGAVGDIAAAVAEAAHWVRATAVRVDHVEPPELRAPFEDALRQRQEGA